MAYDQDAVDAAVALLLPRIEANAAAIDTLHARTDRLEARPVGGTRLADEAMLDLNERLSIQLNATDSDEERATIIRRATDALV